MKNSLRLLLFVLWLGASFQVARASHIVGGEMIYRYLGNDEYEITLKVYRDCFNGVPPFDNPANVYIYNNSILTYTLPIIIPGNDWSDTLDNNGNNPCLIAPPNICVEEAVFVDTITLLPVSGGYTMIWQRCCRNFLSVNLQNPDLQGGTFLETIPDPSLAEGNSSAYFVNFPPTVICVNVPFSFDHSAIDPDGDSLVYSLCTPFDGTNGVALPPPTPPPYDFVDYAIGYSASNPMATTPPMLIDPVTGLLTVTPDAIGNYTVGVCVSEYRDGELLSEHKRDFQFNVTSCTPAVVADIPDIINNCSSYTINFVNNSFGGDVYHWDFGVIGLTNDTSDLYLPTYTFPDTGTYTVTLYANPGTTCGDTTTATVYIYPTLNGAMGVPDGCEGQTINYEDLTTSGFGNVDSWAWKFGDGGTSSQQNPTHDYSGTGTFTVQLIVTTDLGCVDTVTETITIYPNPETEVVPDDTTICYLDVVQLFASGTGNFTWNPNYNLSDPNIANPVASPDVTTTYYLILSNDFGCFDVDSVTIHVFDTVIVSAGNDTTICPGESIQLHGIGGVIFSWSPTGSLNNPDIANPIATPGSTTTYTLTSSVGSCVESDAVTIFVKPFPSITAGPDETICEGTSVQISASGVTDYSWSPSGTLSDPSIPNPIASPTTTTTYTVTGTDSTKCDQVVSDNLTVSVLAAPDITISPDTSIILGTCTDLSVTGGGTYQWTPTTGILGDPTSPDITVCPTEETMYYATITTDLGCTYVDSVLIGIRLDPILVFPSAFSPNTDGKNDYFRPVVLGLASIESFRIYNRWGQVIFENNNVTVIGGPLPVEQSWDGKYKNEDQPVGVYVYYLLGTGIATGLPIERQGNFTLVR